jgi:hypothetical protein
MSMSSFDWYVKQFTSQNIASAVETTYFNRK